MGISWIQLQESIKEIPGYKKSVIDAYHFANFLIRV